MAGRPRIPSEIHKMRGTFRPGEHNEPIEPTGDPLKPDWITGDAEGFWDEMITSIPKGILARSDSYTIAGACRWLCEWRKYDALLEANDGEPYKIIMLATMAWKNFEKAAAKLGLTPVDRAKLRADVQPNGDDSKKRFTARIVG
jgi:hypothetical protein